MAVLTWQNVDGPRQGYGAPSIDNAIRTLNSGFTALQGVDKSFTDAANANFDNQKEQNTGALVNSLANINSIDDLDKHVADGAFNADRLKAQFGGAVDYKTLNDALTKRRGEIQADAENQLKLNEDTDYQKYQPEAQRLAALAFTDPAAYAREAGTAQLGTAGSRILAQSAPWMNDTRQNSTTMRGQDLTHADNQARIGLDRDRFNYDKAQNAKREAKLNTDDAYAAGSKYGYDNAGNLSGNDMVKSFTNSDTYKQMDPAHRAAALKGLQEGAGNATVLTDAQQREATAAFQPLDTLTKQLEDTTNTAKSNFDRNSPAFQVLRGAAPLANMSQTELTNTLAKELDYNNKGELADMISRVAEKYNVPISVVGSAAQNMQTSSAFSLWSFGKPGVKLNMDSLDQAVGRLRDYDSKGQAKEDANLWQKLVQPNTQLKQQGDQLRARLKRELSTGKDTTETHKLIAQLNDATQTRYDQFKPTATLVQQAADNQRDALANPYTLDGAINRAYGQSGR